MDFHYNILQSFVEKGRFDIVEKLANLSVLNNTLIFGLYRQPQAHWIGLHFQESQSTQRIFSRLVTIASNQ